ncbi:MAG: LapA family protein [Deltaproteobacteria bacterium]|nr:LapA family protein [Deltaproteobacteria bacterium]
MRFLRLTFYFLFFLFLLSLGIMFGTENTQIITISFFNHFPNLASSLELPLWIAMGTSFLLGSFLATIVFFGEFLKTQLSIRKLRNELKKVHSESMHVSSPDPEPPSESFEAQNTSEVTVEDVEDYPSSSDEIL